jgi:2-polyprenyl-3-methyl-5-hydroxy-6-metoxy-1,4-benzoquinol methylase
MKDIVLELLHCPTCASTFNFEEKARHNGELLAGRFSCRGCSATFEMENGVPNFLPSDLNQEITQVESSYSSKWNRVPDIYDEGSFATKHQREWYLTRYHWDSEDSFRRFLEQKRTILDAGCGLGRDIRRYASLQREATVIGADLSEGAIHAYAKSHQHSNISVIRADLNQLPFAPSSFDFVACDQVLPCVEDPRASVKRLWSLVKPGGHFAFYVYKKKCPIREFSDDYLREKISKMSAQEAWQASENITRLGKALSDLNVEFVLPANIPELGIKAGRYNLQRFVYYNVIKCFWNDDFSPDENVLVNFDWYHPAYTYRHSVEEVEQWTRDFGMKVLTLDTEDLSGISVLVQKE